MTISLYFTGFSQVLQQDYDALVAFYAATNGDGWTTKTGWLGPNDATVGTWFGVVVESGRVVQISLPNNNLSGTLPAQLADLTALRFLLLGPDQPPFTNQIGGTIPSGIGNLTNLIRLNLQFNTFTGSIPSELSNLPALVRLELSANQLSGTIPASLGNLSTVQFLALGSNSLTGAIPSELGQLTALTSISLAANQLSGSIPVSLGNLSQLISLQLQLNQLSGSLPIELSNLIALRNFYFNNNQLTGGVPSWLGDMTTLEIVQGDNNALAGTLPATLGNLSNLTTLTFTNCQLTGTVPASLTNLGALTFLRLNTNFFTSLPDLSTIGGLSGTSNFQIQNNNLTFESIEPVVAKNPTYSPQRQIPGIANFNVNEGDPITLTYSVGGSVNNYQWYKNNVAIPGATNTTFTVPSAALSDAGTYHLEITNSIATALTLRTENTVVTVAGAPGPEWKIVDVGSTNGLTDVHFADARAGFTGGSAGAFFRTTDGGETWEDMAPTSGLTKNISDIHFIDRHSGWAVGAQGLIVRTENGGLNWTETTFAGVSISTVWFKDNLNGWLGYGNGNLFRTTNGGVSWTSQPTGTSAIIDEIQFVTDQVGYVACASSGGGARVLKTINGGQSWQEINPLIVNSFNALYFFDENRGFVGGLNGFLYSTADGGQNFTAEGRPSNSSMRSINFASDQIGWFSGLNNTLYGTTNGGATWTRITTGLPGTSSLLSVHSIRTDFAWATSTSGVLLKYGAIGNGIVDGYESLVQKTFNAAGEQDFNEAGNFTGTAVRISALSGSSTVAVRLQQEAPVNRQLALLPTPQFANMRWLVTATGTLPQGYEIVFDLDNIPGLPVHVAKNMFRVARRNTEGTGGFELAPSRFEGNKLIAAGTSNHEFTLVLVAGPTVTDVSVCSGDNAVITASGAQAGQTYRWYQNSTDVTPVFTGNPFVVTSVVADATYYVSLTDGVLESIRVPVLVEVRTCDNLFIVNSALDTPDANVGDGICDDGNGNCTLRAAIQEVNTLTAPAAIHFDIPGTGPHRIQPVTALPTIQQKVEIDARTQPGFTTGSPVVELSGTLAGNTNGLHFEVNAAGSAVLGFSITGFQQMGLRINANEITVQGNLIGLRPDGNTAAANGQGIYLINASNCLIGGSSESARNIISGNTNYGIWLVSGSNTTLAGNYIGLNEAGTAAVPNRNGVFVQGTNNFIGGAVPAFTNVISGNGIADTFIDMGLGIEGAGNVVRGNIIGLNPTGTIAIPNEDGLRISSANVVIGGPNEADKNIISGNTRYGVATIGSSIPNLLLEGNFIGTNLEGTLALGNARAGIFLGGSSNSIIRNNLVSGNAQFGFESVGANNSILGNKVGTDHTGTFAVPNPIGIRIGPASSTNNLIGGANEDEGNLIAGNSDIGIYLFAAATNNTIRGNMVGLTSSLTPLPNGTGIYVAFSYDNIIGGTLPGERNIIAHNSVSGVRISKLLVSDLDPQRNRVTGNSIYSNSGLGIAIASTSVQVNDPDDSDDGPNKLQNYPLIYSYSYDAIANTITVTYDVSSNPVTGNSVYPIDVEFFLDDGNRQGRSYLHTDVYTAANFTAKLKTITFAIPASVAFTATDQLVSTATDADGNTSEFGFIAPAPASANGVEQCLSSSVTLVASGAPVGGGYRWFANENDVTPVSTSQSFITQVLTAPTTFYLAARDLYGHESLRVPVTVIIGSAPVKPLVTNASACSSSSLVLTATGAALGYEYVWYENLTDTNPIVKNSTGEFSTPVLTATRSYFVSILTNEGCESERTEVIAEISVLPAPTVTAQGGFGFCEGGSVTLEGPSGFTSYLWSDNSTNKDLTVNTAGTYTLRVVDTNGCESQPTAVVVTQNANPVATITMSNDRLVTGQAASYQWFLFDEAIVGATESFLEINVVRYGIYSVRLISSAGCAVLSDPFVYLITGYEADQKKGVVLYPNPTSGTLSIQIENDVRMKSYTIYDNVGKTMLQREAVSIDALDVTDWPSGIYTVQIEVENKTLTRRIIKL